MLLRCLVVLITVLFLHTSSFADLNLKSTLEDQSALEITVYNSNLGLVKDTRSIKISKGFGQLSFMDVAGSIMPETVNVKPLGISNSLAVLEQNFEYDLINESKLLDKYVGKKIKLLKENIYSGQKETVEAILLSNNNGQVYQVADEVYLGFPGQKILPQIPENLIAQPTLTWIYNSEVSDAQQVEVSYLTNNINWKSDYVLSLDSTDTQASLLGWVTIDNKSGAVYKNAKLKLVAGKLNRVQSEDTNERLYKSASMSIEGVAAPQFVEQSFFEYHIYDLQRPTTIKDNQTKQIQLLQVENIKVEKEFTVKGNPYYYYQDYRNGQEKLAVDVSISFKNSKENNLSMPLPAGIMRLYKADGSKSLQFIGEDHIDHTPKDETVRLKIGEAFDVVAERKQTDFRVISRNVYETSWEVTLRNHKAEDIKVAVLENLASFGQWQILSSSSPYEKLNVSNIKFVVSVPKDQEVKLVYQVRIKYGY